MNFHLISRYLRGIFNHLFRRRQMEAALRYMNVTLREGEYHAQAIYDSSPALATLAQELGRYLDSQDAPNFVEVSMFDPANFKRYRLTIQREGKPTPSGVRTIMRKALEDIAKMDEGDASERARVALRCCNYSEREEE